MTKVMRFALIGICVGAVISARSPDPALAGTCGAGVGYTAYGNTGGQYGGKIGESGMGMKVLNPDVECNQVRSVVVWVDLNNYAEVGYFEDPSGNAEQCQTFVSPRLLVYAVTSGTVKCKQDPPVLAAGSWYKVRVQNPDHDNKMHYYYGTSYQGFFTVSFNQGNVRSFTERHHPTSESLNSNMDGLAYMGASDNWNVWTNQTHTSTGDVSGWTFCEESELHYRVIQGSC